MKKHDPNAITEIAKHVLSVRCPSCRHPVIDHTQVPPKEGQLIAVDDRQFKCDERGCRCVLRWRTMSKLLTKGKR